MNRFRIPAILAVVFILAGPAASEDWDGIPPIKAEPLFVSANPASFQHATCEIMPWGVFTAVQTKQTAPYDWSRDQDIRPLFEGKGYKPTQLTHPSELKDGELLSYMVSSCGKERKGLFGSQFICYSIIQIRIKDSKVEEGSRILFQVKPPHSLMQTDPNSLQTAQVNSIRVALRGIPGCQVAAQ